jgi:uncharacterized protein YlxP (DUF503 family)
MFIGTLQIELYLPGCLSLKEKRFVLQSLKSRLRNKFNVSVAEVDYLDKWQRTVIACAVVSNEKKHVDSMLDSVFRFIDQDTHTEIVEHLREIF